MKFDEWWKATHKEIPPVGVCRDSWNAALGAVCVAIAEGKWDLSNHDKAEEIADILILVRAMRS